MIVVYHNPLWSKSRKSVEILKEKKIQFKIIEYLKTGVTKPELIQIAKKLNLRPKDFIRKNDKLFKENDFTSLLEDDNKIFNLIVENPKILERPIVVDKNKAIIARPPERLLDSFLL
jgi:arsenate reductase